MPTIQKIAVTSILVALCVLCLKAGAWWVTGSVALFSDGTESLVNLASASVAFVSIRMAARDPDERHPFGLHKAELSSALFGGTLIIVAAVTILWQSVAGLLNPRPITSAGLGIGLTIVASMMNAGWCAILLRQGRNLRSPALMADGRHLMADVLFSFAVILGLFGATQTGWHILDPMIAGIVALNILRSGLSVVHDSWRGLMDEALPQDQQDRIRAVIAAEASEKAHLVALRTRRAGRASFAEIRLSFPPHTTARLSAAIERALLQALPGCHAVIVAQPHDGPKSQRHGVVPLHLTP